jgi:hypothetical protein
MRTTNQKVVDARGIIEDRRLKIKLLRKSTELKVKMLTESITPRINRWEIEIASQEKIIKDLLNERDKMRARRPRLDVIEAIESNQFLSREEKDEATRDESARASVGIRPNPAWLDGRGATVRSLEEAQRISDRTAEEEMRELGIEGSTETSPVKIPEEELEGEPWDAPFNDD